MNKKVATATNTDSEMSSSRGIILFRQYRKLIVSKDTLSGWCFVFMGITLMPLGLQSQTYVPGYELH